MMVVNFGNYELASFMNSDPVSIVITLIIALIVLIVIYKVARPFITAAVVIAAAIVGLLVLELILQELGYTQMANHINTITQIIYFVVDLLISGLESMLDFLQNNSDQVTNNTTNGMN